MPIISTPVERRDAGLKERTREREREREKERRERVERQAAKGGRGGKMAQVYEES